MNPDSDLREELRVVKEREEVLEKEVVTLKRLLEAKERGGGRCLMPGGVAEEEELVDLVTAEKLVEMEREVEEGTGENPLRSSLYNRANGLKEEAAELKMQLMKAVMASQGGSEGESEQEEEGEEEDLGAVKVVRVTSDDSIDDYFNKNAKEEAWAATEAAWAAEKVGMVKTIESLTRELAGKNVRIAQLEAHVREPKGGGKKVGGERERERVRRPLGVIN